jgi:hypothetical protein
MYSTPESATYRPSLPLPSSFQLPHPQQAGPQRELDELVLEAEPPQEQGELVLEPSREQDEPVPEPSLEQEQGELARELPQELVPEPRPLLDGLSFGVVRHYE